MEDKVLLNIEGLDMSFKTHKGLYHALRGVSLRLHRGETVALVGESGSGKSVTMKTVVGLTSQNAVFHGGKVEINMTDENGNSEMVDLLKKDTRWIRRNINGKKVAMVFQDPMTSLDPLMPVGRQITEAILLNEKMTKQAAYDKAVSLLTEVGITEPEKRMKQYPHQLSGGQRQRVVIAIALSCNPEILICDEPTTALDVTIQAKILNLITELQITRNLAVIIITHNLGVVARVADYIYVMYAGKVVEKGSEIAIFYDPRHPYTWGLLSAVPTLDTSDKRLYAIPGTPPNLLHEIKGDAFAPRNEYAMNIDFREEPPMFKVSGGHYAATWLLDERAPKVEVPDAVKAKIERMKAEVREVMLHE